MNLKLIIISLIIALNKNHFKRLAFQNLELEIKKCVIFNKIMLKFFSRCALKFS